MDFLDYLITLKKNPLVCSAVKPFLKFSSSYRKLVPMNSNLKINYMLVFFFRLLTV